MNEYKKLEIALVLMVVAVLPSCFVPTTATIVASAITMSFLCIYSFRALDRARNEHEMKCTIQRITREHLQEVLEELQAVRATNCAGCATCHKEAA